MNYFYNILAPVNYPIGEFTGARHTNDALMTYCRKACLFI